MSESKPKNDGGRELEGQLVAGTGTAEGYSREGSDADGRLSHVEDPTRGAKASSLTPPPTCFRCQFIEPSLLPRRAHNYYSTTWQFGDGP